MPKSKKPVYFRSVNDEGTQFVVAGYKAHRPLIGRYIMWRVPAEDAERFEAHHFVTVGRVRRMTTKELAAASGEEQKDS